MTLFRFSTCTVVSRLVCALNALSAAALCPTPAQAQVVRPCGKQAPAHMACIPGGPFLRGSDDGPTNSRPRTTIWLQTFYMDRHEVTVQRYKACVAARKCRPARTIYDDYSRPQQPKVGVSWYHAVAYCKAMGQRLPTEAQWEKAARGTDGRLFPWGDQPATCKRAVIKDASGRSCGIKKKGRSPHKGRTLVVGTRPANQYGLFDMCGNSWEWVHDWYSPSYQRCGDACRGPDPKGPCGGKRWCQGHKAKLVRGGSWYWPASWATTIYRRPHYPSNQPYHHFGFRCAATLEDVEQMKPKAEGKK